VRGGGKTGDVVEKGEKYGRGDVAFGAKGQAPGEASRGKEGAPPPTQRDLRGHVSGNNKKSCPGAAIPQQKKKRREGGGGGLHSSPPFFPSVVPDDDIGGLFLPPYNRVRLCRSFFSGARGTIWRLRGLFVPKIV